MAQLFPYRDEVAAHLARSKLLAHGIAAAVVHDQASAVYGRWITRPRLLVADADLEPAAVILATPDEPIADDFIEAHDPNVASEDLGLRHMVPPFSVCVALGLAISASLTVIAIAVATLIALTDGAYFTPAAELTAGEAILAGVLFAGVVWPLVRFANSCRHRDDGKLPFRARVTWLLIGLLYGAYFVLLLALPLWLIAAAAERLRRPRNSRTSAA